MTESDDPSRLSDPSGPAGLRDSLRAARADVGSDAQVARLAARLGPLLGPVVPPVPAAAGLSAAAKAGLVGLGLIVAAGGAWRLSGSGTPSQPASRPPAPALSHPATPAGATGAAVATAAPEGVPAVVVEVQPAPSAILPSAKAPPPAQPSEADLLEQARAAMKGDPGRALQRANEHAARYPHGVLVQEREVIAIQALRQLGRTAEAERRAAAFAKAFPGSAFQRKLNATP